jgi:hypothetical protein
MPRKRPDYLWWMISVFACIGAGIVIWQMAACEQKPDHIGDSTNMVPRQVESRASASVRVVKPGGAK